MFTLTITLAVIYLAVYAYNLFAWQALIGQASLADVPYMVVFTLEHILYNVLQFDGFTLELLGHAIVVFEDLSMLIS